MNQNQAIPCHVLSFSPEQMEDIRVGLTDLGYSPDTDGLKKFILESLSGTGGTEEPPEPGPADRVIHRIADYLKENPDTVRMYGRLAGNLLDKVLKKQKGAAR